MVTQLQVNSDGSEQVRYLSKEFPVCVTSYALLSQMNQYAALCHWHRDFEFLLVYSGQMDYFVNGCVITLGAGEGVFVNAGRLHYGFSPTRSECAYGCMLFHPSILGELPLPMARYALLLGEDCQRDFLLLSSDTPEDRECMETVHHVMELADQQPPLYELAIQGQCGHLLTQLWKKIPAEKTVDPEWVILRQMVGHIQSHYASRLRLEDIAAAGAVCRSKCSRIFREKMGVSPVAYLNDYRLDRAAELLKSTGASITDIAYSCGFESPSYFAEVFRRRFRQTPRELRRGE